MIGMTNNIKTLKLDVTHIIREKHICDICLGGIKNIPLILVGEESYDIFDSTMAIKRKESPVGIVTSEGMLYSSLDGRFYIEIQTFFDLECNSIDSCEFIVVNDILNISAFIIYEN